MKDKIKLLGIIVFMAMIGFSMTGCPGEPSTSPFEGTWNHTNGRKLIFSGTNWSITTTGGVNQHRGTFSYTSSNLSITVTQDWESGSWKATDFTPGVANNRSHDYTISGSSLTINGAFVFLDGGWTK